MNIVSQITGVFTSIGTWISSAMNDLMPMFYSSENGLTLLGTLAICGLAFSVVFLLLNIIQNFLHFRG